MENNGADRYLVLFYPDVALSDHLQHLDCLDCCLTGLEMLVHYHLAVLDTPECIVHYIVIYSYNYIAEVIHGRH